MKFFGRDTKRSRGSAVECVYISCFWSLDDKISKSEATALYNSENIICRACKGCQ